MIAGVVLYFVIISAVLLFDGLFVYTQASKSKSTLFGCNFLRYVRPVEILLSLFSVVMLELVACEKGMLTSGFVGYTAIILAVIAGVYLVELGIKEYKFNKLTMVVANITKRQLTSLVAKEDYRYHYDDLYMAQGEIDRINALSIADDKDATIASANGSGEVIVDISATKKSNNLSESDVVVANDHNVDSSTSTKAKKVKKKASPIKIYMLTRVIMAAFMLIVMIVSIIALTMAVTA